MIILESYSPPSCSEGEYYDIGTLSCEHCASPCSTCTAAGTSSCTDCEDGYYLDSTTCMACDINCSTCSGPGDQACLSCAPGTLSVFETNTCVFLCSDYAATTTQVIPAALSAIQTVEPAMGPPKPLCNACVLGSSNSINLPASPVYCVSSCPPSTYFQPPNQCHECMQHC